MTRVTHSSDCGNSPKNQFAETIAIALEKGDVKTISAAVDTATQWQLDGVSLHEDAIVDKLKQRAAAKPGSLVIGHVVTHGKKGAVSGVSRFKQGNSREFCHVIEFADTKCDRISTVSSYHL